MASTKALMVAVFLSTASAQLLPITWNICVIRGDTCYASGSCPIGTNRTVGPLCSVYSHACCTGTATSCSSIANHTCYAQSTCPEGTLSAAGQPCGAGEICCSGTPIKRCGVPITDPAGRIVNGETDLPHDNPWLVRIVDTASGIHYCDGTLIEENWVLLDGFCFTLCTGPAGITCSVVLGDYALGTPESTEENRGILQFYPHDLMNFKTTDELINLPGPQEYLVNNIVLAKLDSPAVIKYGVNIACPPRDVKLFVPRKDQVCKIAGFGTTSNTDITASPSVRQEVNVSIILDDSCELFRQLPQPVGMDCAVTENTNTRLCFGDNGGGVMCQGADGSWSVEGIVVFLTEGSGNCFQERLVVFTNMNEVWGWITNTIANS